MSSLTEHHQDPNEYVPRLKLLLYCAIGLVFIIIARLWYLQIIKGSTYERFSQQNSIWKMWTPAPRGIIFDKDGRIIVDNRASFNLSLTRAYITDPHKTLDYLNSIFKIDEIIFNEKKAEFLTWPRYKQYTFYKDVSREQLASLETNKQDPILNGIYIDVIPVRNYRYGLIGAHMLGYLGEIDRAQFKTQSENSTFEYRLGSLIGKFGLEKKYEEVLRGLDGIEPVEIDVRGRIRKTLPVGEIPLKELQRNPEPGKDIYLTIDMDLQKVAYESFKEGEGGSIVALNPNTGEILAMVSLPSFDPSIFATKIDSSFWVNLANDPAHPLQDRSTSGIYAPASTYKIIMAIAGLEEGAINENTSFYCPGHLQVGNRDFKCWRKEGHGKLQLRDALIQSCDVFFYKVGLELGPDKIAKYAKMFGYGALTDLNLNTEKKGLVPTSEWKLKAIREPWQLGETPSISIGQGYNQVTPIQLAKMISLVATKGKSITPHILKDTALDDVSFKKRSKIEMLPIKDSTWTIIHEALMGVANNPAGTAFWNAKSKLTKIAGKTGTAQVVAMDEKGKTPTGKEFVDHALFVAYAPADGIAQIAVAVVSEHGGHGSSGAAPKAKAVIDAFIQKYNDGLPKSDKVIKDGKENQRKY